MALQKHTRIWIYDNAIHTWTANAEEGMKISFPLDEEIPYIALSDGTILKINGSTQLAIEASGGNSHVRTAENGGEVAIEIYCETGFSWVLYGKHLAPFSFCY